MKKNHLKAMITLALHNTRALLIDKPRKRWGIVGMPYDFNNLSHFILRKQDLHQGPKANV